ncbi:MAG: FAD-binding oxidoreductase [Alphaproteobacteria bacterium]|nr:FAD-binding oxidoreductase [Alphaproteobacteria bacterium]
MKRRQFLRAGLMSAAGAAALLSGGGLGALARPLENDPDMARREAAEGVVVNDVHGQISRTRVAYIRTPSDTAALEKALEPGGGVALSGGRHAMGGQQFAAGRPLIDMRAMDKVIRIDRAARTVTAEAGITWPALIAALNRDAPELSIIQKQTGADDLTLGGALSANIHGRGLVMAPIIGDVESFTLRTASDGVVTCSRSENSELFALAIGGYGLFGVIQTVTLRLMPRRKLRREVQMLRIDALMPMVEQRIAEGCWYGDFQYKTDPTAEDFMRTGVFCCYRPVEDHAILSETARNLSLEDWQSLYDLAHDDKKTAFEKYSAYYLASHGNVYWSDSHQTSTYLKDQNVKYDTERKNTAKSSLVISEIYAEREKLTEVMEACRAAALRRGMNIVYGTVRFIEQDTESFLPWARKKYACIIFNLHVRHTVPGLAKAQEDFRTLFDIALDHGGSFYLTYHRWARKEQVLSAYPQMHEFLALKRKYDPYDKFVSDWYAHYREMFPI